MSSSKKNVKKSTQLKQVPVVPFNKKNAEAFSQALYAENGNTITFTRLCDGSLVEGYGKQTVHCAVGEAYFQFVSRNPKDMLRLGEVGEDDGDGDYGYYHSKYGASVESEDGATLEAIDALVDAASLKGQGLASKKRLAAALSLCVESNDDGNTDAGNADYVARAQAVQNTWKRRVLPLLK
jgi:hypothetical protein